MRKILLAKLVKRFQNNDDRFCQTRMSALLHVYKDKLLCSCKSSCFFKSDKGKKIRNN